MDVLLVPAAEEAVAIECKRVKAKAGGHDRGELTKLEGLSKVPRQTQGLLQIGFHRVYLAVLVQVEGWPRTEAGAYVFRGVRPAHVEAVLEHPGVGNLPEEAGIVFLHIVHPTGRPLEDAGAVGVEVVRQAARRPQPVGLTGLIRSHVRA